VEYYADLRSEKKNKSGKYKGGKWVDHISIPRFTTKVRTDDLKAMDNYIPQLKTFLPPPFIFLFDAMRLEMNNIKILVSI